MAKKTKAAAPTFTPQEIEAARQRSIDAFNIKQAERDAETTAALRAETAQRDEERRRLLGWLPPLPDKKGVATKDVEALKAHIAAFADELEALAGERARDKITGLIAASIGYGSLIVNSETRRALERSAAGRRNYEKSPKSKQDEQNADFYRDVVKPIAKEALVTLRAMPGKKSITTDRLLEQTLTISEAKGITLSEETLKKKLTGWRDKSAKKQWSFRD